jgi:galactose-1-phosphate uridylyltransferase
LHQGRIAHGFHFLQWTSTLHDKDFHNMPIDDCMTVLTSLSALESRLLYGSRDIMPPSDQRDSKRTRGFVSIIKNYGRFSGGSLAHGHQQIGFSNMMPRRIYNNRTFQRKRGETFSAFLQEENSPDLIVRDYGAAKLVVPYFMRRPFHLLLVIKDFSKQYVHELNDEELRAVAQGLQDGILALIQMISRLGRVPSYSITTSNGPGAGLYFEFHPYTQETGGFEHIGLWICQESPLRAAEKLRAILDGDSIPDSAPSMRLPVFPLA